MRNSFHQLSYDDRVAICTLRRAGVSQNQIAKQLHVHRSTISRELARNAGFKLGYLPLLADNKLKARRKRRIKLASDKTLNDYVLTGLKLGWSPEQIAGRLKRDHAGKSQICHETIYAYIYSEYGIRNKWHRCLRRRRLRRMPRVSRHSRMKIPNRVSIHERPQPINDRQVFGHWEGDLMLFGRSGKVNLITLRERISRLMIAICNPSKQAKTTADKIIKALEDKKAWVNSLTFDNGLEFSAHETIASHLEARTYFCDPYKSYQKGAIENGNKQIRVDLPRDTALERINQKRVNYLVNRLNNRPMKCLGYETPLEVFESYTRRQLSG